MVDAAVIRCFALFPSIIVSSFDIKPKDLNNGKKEGKTEDIKVLVVEVGGDGIWFEALKPYLKPRYVAMKRHMEAGLQHKKQSRGWVTTY